MPHILVIDDEASVRAFIRQALEDAGYRISEAPDGEQGLLMLHNTLVDLVVTDIFMPHKEGIETIRTVRQQFPQIKILAISGGGSRRMEVLPSALQFGAHYTLTKPFTPEELLAAVNTTLTM
jgi:DNA-binding response OmpR family regulator